LALDFNPVSFAALCDSLGVTAHFPGNRVKELVNAEILRQPDKFFGRAIRLRASENESPID